MYDFAAIVSEIAPDQGEPLRLRDIVAGLRAGEIGAQTFIDRLPPDLADEIRAVALHRGASVESFVVGALLTFALDAADEAWRRLESRGADGDGEARALEALMGEAVRRELGRDARLGATGKAERPTSAARRVAPAD